MDEARKWLANSDHPQWCKELIEQGERCDCGLEIVRSLLAELEQQSEPFPVLQVGDYKLDSRSFQLISPRGSIDLTRVQFDLLNCLMRHKGQAMSTDRLLQEVWDYPHGAGSSDLVRVHIRTLRMKIEVDHTKPEFIKTVRGRGYIVALPPEDRED